MKDERKRRTTNSAKKITGKTFEFSFKMWIALSTQQLTKAETKE